ncbi:MAG: DUF3048 domain-containing protein [Lachnospiraceae bacterium]|nr:DUF3048 domain-containing protein [Lachnospiraceae bacterium]
MNLESQEIMMVNNISLEKTCRRDFFGSVNKVISISLLMLICLILFVGCGGRSESNPQDANLEEEAPADPNAYADFEKDQGTVSESDMSQYKQDAMSTIVAEYDYESSYGVPQEEKDGKVRSYLTGRLVDSSIGKRRPIAVMLNNIKEAQPMSGSSYADIIYECVVEGSLTRLMGIFENWDDLGKIGSVRSCRNYFVYYALELDSIYCHYGQSAYAMPLLEQPYVDNLSGLAGDVGNIVYYRTTDRVAPHNAYASAKGIKKGIEIKGYDMDYSPDYQGKFTFARDGEIIVPSTPDATDCRHVEPGYLINKPWFEYNESDGKYYRYEYDEPQIDAENDEQLSVDNIILQYSSWEVVDEKGYLGFNCHSGGLCTYISHGKSISGVWIRFGGDEGSVRYFDAEGKEIVVNQGKTWICIIQDTMADKVVLS